MKPPIEYRPKPMSFQSDAVAVAKGEKAPARTTIMFVRDRATYNAYQRDYKKAKKLGITVAQYRNGTPPSTVALKD